MYLEGHGPKGHSLSSPPFECSGTSELGMPSTPNTRKHQRLPIAFPVFVHGKDHDGRQYLEFASVLNVSAGGALLLLRRLPGNKHISMEIPLTPGIDSSASKAVRTMRGRIVRTEAHQQHMLVGLQFDHPLPVLAPPVAASS